MIKKTKVKKKPPIEENEFRFHLFIQKALFQLNEIKNKTHDELIAKWKKKKRKRLTLAKRNLGRKEWSSELAQKVIKGNIEYTERMEFPITIDIVKANFEIARNSYICWLEENKPDNYIEQLNIARQVDILKPTKETNNRFGELIVKLVNNRMRSPNFANYHNWDIEFYSDSIEKTLLYLENYDTNLLSPRTGDTPLAFAYITSITNFAFISVINKFKKHELFIKEQIKKKTDQESGLFSFSTNSSEVSTENTYSIKTINYEGEAENFEEFLLALVDELNVINLAIENNEYIKADIYSLKIITPEIERNNMYYKFISDLEQKVDNNLPTYKYEEIIIIKSTKIKITNDYDIENYRLNIINTY